MTEKELEWEKEHLQHEASEYLLKVDVTPEELTELLQWIKSGNSVYDNPWYLYDESGHLMDYVAAMRDIPDLVAQRAFMPCESEPSSEICTQNPTAF